MNVLSLAGVSKTLAGAPLFEDVTLGIDAGEKIGFVGRNGSGKSTFLKILTGEIEPDVGSVSRNRDLSIATLEQRPSFMPEMTLEEVLLGSRDRLIRPETEEGAAVLDSFHSYCRELGLTDPAARVRSFSGGMVRKAAIARCLALGAGFLTLDEPTNHLDLDTIVWLEALLRNAPFGFVLVTHDRYFLDAVCTAMLEVEGRRIYKFPGSYASYLERKAERAEVQERSEQRRSSILRVELEWLKRGPRARTGKDKGRKDRIQVLLDGKVRKEASLRGFSSAHRRLGKKVLELHGVSKSFGGTLVVGAFSHSFRTGERIGIIGPNGSGKTTFLTLASGGLAPDSGTVVKGVNTVFAHFDQTGSAIDGTLTVIEFMRELAERIPTAEGGTLSPEQFLEKFLFPRDMQSLPLERLSGGEFRRLCLVRLLATAPNFLLLDEPTNDLDLDTIRLLESYLAEFTGCILLVSHDRALLERLTDSLLVFDGSGGITGFTGSYDEYRAAREGEKTRITAPVPRADRERPARTDAKKGLSFKERQEYEGLLDEIVELEAEQRELEAAFQQPVTEPGGMEKRTRRYRELAPLIAEKLARWEMLAGRAGE